VQVAGSGLSFIASRIKCEVDPPFHAELTGAPPDDGAGLARLRKENRIIQERDILKNAAALGYAMGRAYALGPSSLSDEVSSAWQVLASLTNYPIDKRNGFERERVAWEALAAASNSNVAHSNLFPWPDPSDGSSVLVLRELYETGQVPELLPAVIR
jgi:hypothetical protein